MRIVLGIMLLALTGSNAAAQDPTSVSPADYKVEIDNEWVRVLRVMQAPGAKTGPYQTVESITVYPFGGHEKFTDGQGRSQEVTRTPGEIMHFPAGKRSQENLSDKPLEKVIVELKPFGPKHGMPPANLDPVKVEPEHVKAMFENDQVRVLLTRLEARFQNPLHAHPHNVVVFIMGPQTSSTPDGKVVEARNKPGRAHWVEASQHATLNATDDDVVEVQVEIK